MSARRKQQEVRSSGGGVSAGRLAAGLVLLGIIGGGGYVGFHGGFDGLTGLPETSSPAANPNAERKRLALA